MVIPLIDEDDSKVEERLLTIGGRVFLHTSRKCQNKKRDCLRLARAIAGPFDAKDADTSFDWLESGAMCVLIEVRDVASIDMIRESGLPKNRVLVYVDCSSAQTKDVLYATSILMNKLTPLVSGVYVRVKDTECVNKEFLDTIKICCGVVVLEKDKVVPLSEIKRLEDLRVQVACRCTPEYLGKSIVSCIRSDRPDGLYTTVVVNRLGMFFVCVLFEPSQFSFLLSIEQAWPLDWCTAARKVSWKLSRLDRVYTTRGREKDFGVRVQRVVRRRHCIVLILIVTVMPYVFTWSSTAILLHFVT